MLRDSLYSILQSNQDWYVIRFDASHPIFFGHFPEHPIVPGACLVQIAEELAAITYGHSVCFMAIRDLKFRQPITPDQVIAISIRQITELTCKVLCVDSMNNQQLILSFNVQIIVP